jgi:hypothetical protein
MAIKSGSGAASATLSATSLIVNSVNGLATFAAMKISLNSTIPYVLRATTATLPLVDSNPFTCQVTPGNASRLVWAQAASVASASGVVFVQQPKVSITDSSGAVILTATNPITLSIANSTYLSNPAFPLDWNGAPRIPKLYGTTVQNAVQGVSTFTDLYIDVAYTAYTLVASMTGLPTLSSSNIIIAPGTATQLFWTTQPNPVQVKLVVFSNTPCVGFLDAFMNLVTSNAQNITINIRPGTQTDGAVMTGNLNAMAVNGIASFPGLMINLPGKLYQLDATAVASSIPPVTSQVINVANTFGAPALLLFVQQPSSAVSAGVAFPVQPKVQVTDANANPVVFPEQTIVLTIKSGTGVAGSAVGGTFSLQTRFGVATFTDVSLNLAGTNYALTASCNSLGLSVDSSPLSVVVDTPVALAFRSNPPALNVVNVPFATSVVVTVNDPAGNVVPWVVSSITITLIDSTTGKPAVGASISSGYTTMSAVNGVCEFLKVSINAPGSYMFLATSGYLTYAVSTVFQVQTASTNVAVTAIYFLQQPPAIQNAMVPLANPVMIALTNSLGKVVVQPSQTWNVDLSLSDGSGKTFLWPANASKLTQKVYGGVATFTDLVIQDIASPMYLVATAYTTYKLTGKSIAMNIVAGPPTQWVLTQQPALFSTISTTFIVQPQVKLVDAYGYTVITTCQVTLSLKPGTGPAGATLSASVLQVYKGVGTFSDAVINTIGSGYILVVKSDSVPAPVNLPYNVTTSAVGAASQAVTNPVQLQQPEIARISTLMDLSDFVSDNLHNHVVVNMGIPSANPYHRSSETVQTQSSVPTSSSSTSTSSSTSLFGSTPTSYPVSFAYSTSLQIQQPSGTPTKLVLLNQPAGVKQFQLFSSPLQIGLFDATGICATKATNAVTVTVNPSTVKLSGATQRTPISCVATFADLTIDSPGLQYTLTFTASGLTSAQSSAFDVAGDTFNIKWVSQPQFEAVGVAFEKKVTIQVIDKFGALIPVATDAITIVLPSNPAQALLQGTFQKAAVAGIATFDDLSVDTMGSYSIIASITLPSGEVKTITSNKFQVLTIEGKKVAIEKAQMNPVDPANDPSVIIPMTLAVVMILLLLGTIVWLYFKSQSAPSLEDIVPLPPVQNRILAKFGGQLNKQASSNAESSLAGIMESGNDDVQPFSGEGALDLGDAGSGSNVLGDLENIKLLA